MTFDRARRPHLWMERLPTGSGERPEETADAAPGTVGEAPTRHGGGKPAPELRPRDPADAARLLLVLLAASLAGATIPHLRGKPPPVAVVPVRIDLDRAPAGLLRALPGVGRVLAARIVAARAERPFASVEDLLRVPGVGPSLVARIAPHAVAGAAPVEPGPVGASRPDGAERR